MKRTIFMLNSSAVALLLTTAFANAQSIPFSQIDRNSDGQLSQSELQSAFGDRAGNALWRKGNGNALSRNDINAINRDDDDDDNGRGGLRNDNDDDDDNGRGNRGGRDDDDDDGRDDDDDNGRDGRDDDDDDGRDDNDDDD